MLVVDADSHLIEPIDWLDREDIKLAAELKERAPVSLMEMLMGEILESVPVDQRPGVEELIPPSQRAAVEILNGAQTASEQHHLLKELGLDVMFNPPGGWKADERVAFCDSHKIDIQVCLPNFALPMIFGANRAGRDLGRRVAAAYNRWTTANLSGHLDRLIPVVFINLDDVAEAEQELRLARERGARVWLLPANPVDGRTLGDSRYDRLWAASVDLGIVPMLHVGVGAAHFAPSWGQLNGKPNAFQIMSYVNILGPVVAQMALSSMIYGGVFDRYPKLVVSVSEFGLGWIDEWIERVGPTNRSGAPNATAFFPWDLEKSPDEYLVQNIRFTPLRGQNVEEIIHKFGPDVMMYASDYPHPEGIQVDWGFYDRQLERSVDAQAKAKFYGGNMAKLLGLDAQKIQAAT